MKNIPWKWNIWPKKTTRYVGIVNITNFSFSTDFFFPNDEVGNDIEEANNDDHQKTEGEVVEVTENEEREDPEGEIGDCEWKGHHDCQAGISESLVVMVYSVNQGYHW